MKELVEELKRKDLSIPSKLWDFIWNETDFRTNPTLKVARYVEYIDEWRGLLLKRVFAFKSYSKKRSYDDIQIVEVMRKIEGQRGCLLASIWHDMAGHHVAFDEYGRDTYFWDNKTEWSFWNCYTMYDKQKIIDKYHLDYCQYFSDMNKSYMNFFDYICAYRKEPRIELLVKAGLSQFVHCYKKLNLKGKSLDQIFRINNYWVSHLKELSYWDIMNIRNKKRHIKTMDDLVIIRNFLYGMSRDFNMIKKYACPKMYDYLGGKDYRFKEDYNDYLEFCEKLEYDLNDYSILCPKNMKKEHDRAMNLITIKKDELTNSKFFEAYKKLLDYVYSENSLVIIPCEKFSELENESKILGHCVRNYSDRYANQETNIMFIRNVNEIENPLYTLEFKNGRVIQCRGKSNDLPNERGLEFVRHWAKIHELGCTL